MSLFLKSNLSCGPLVDDILRLRFPFLFHIIAYADDLTVATSHKDAHMATANLQLVCNAIVNWCVESKLTLNAIKTIFMLFSSKAIKFASLNLSSSIIYDVNILPSIETQFLGFTLDNRLKWASHIAHKVLKTKKALFTLLKCLRATWGPMHIVCASLLRLQLTPLSYMVARYGHHSSTPSAV